MRSKYKLLYKDEPLVSGNNYSKNVLENFTTTTPILLYVESGGKITMNEQVFNFEDSSVMLIPRGADVEIQLYPERKKCFFICIIIREDLIWHYQYNFDNNLDLKIMHRFHLIDKESFGQIFQSFKLYMSQDVSISEMILRNKFCEVFYILNQLLARSYHPAPMASSKNNSMWEAILINSLCVDECVKSIKEIARDFGVSPATLKRHFKRDFDMSIKKWLSDKKLDKAKFLLESTNKTLKEISLDCGFCCSSYLIRLYKRRFGDTPMKHIVKTAQAQAA